MARKKKKNAPGKGDRQVILSREAEEELVSKWAVCHLSTNLPPGASLTFDFKPQVALEAIFSTPGDDDCEVGTFTRHEDGKGFDLAVVPHPGDAEANFVWADIKIRSHPFRLPLRRVCIMLGSCWKLWHSWSMLLGSYKRLMAL